MQNIRIHTTLLMRFTENDYLCDDLNEQDGFFDMKGIKMKVQPFTSGAEHRLLTHTKNFGGINSEKPLEKYKIEIHTN